METQFFTFLGLFAMGFSLNFTPCVYPMIAVTVSLFGGQGQVKPSKAFLRATLYVSGLVIMYSSLGLLAAFTGGLFGALLQNRWVLGTIALILFLLALSLFGLFRLQLPTRLLNKLAGKQRVGLLGLFFSGVLAGIFAAPCVGPPIVALLTYIGMRGDPLFGFGALFVLSLGLGSPYIVLGSFSGLLNKLPRSGVWLVWVERLFGVVLLVVATFYLSIGFIPKFVPWILPLSFLAGGVYLGFVERSGKGHPVFAWMKRGFGLCLIAVGFLVPISTPKETVAWEAFRMEKLAEAREAGKPVVIDFYADWCIPCHELERHTYSDPDVIRELESFVKLQVDLTRLDDPVATEAADYFKVIAMPTIIFLGPDGEEAEESRLVGFIGPGAFVDLLRHLKEKFGLEEEVFVSKENSTKVTKPLMRMPLMFFL